MMQEELRTLPITKSELAQRKRDIFNEIDHLKEYYKSKDKQYKETNECIERKNSIENPKLKTLRHNNSEDKSIKQQLEKEIEKLSFKVRQATREFDELNQQNHNMQQTVNKIAYNANDLKKTVDSKQMYLRQVEQEKNKADAKCQDLADQVRDLENQMKLDIN